MRRARRSLRRGEVRHVEEFGRVRVDVMGCGHIWHTSVTFTCGTWPRTIFRSTCMLGRTVALRRLAAWLKSAGIQMRRAGEYVEGLA